MAVYFFFGNYHTLGTLRIIKLLMLLLGKGLAFLFLYFLGTHFQLPTNRLLRDLSFLLYFFSFSQTLLGHYLYWDSIWSFSLLFLNLLPLLFLVLSLM